MKREIIEVDNFFYDADSHFYCIDAYYNDSEEGKVVAVVHRSGDVWFVDNDVRTNELVIEAINEVKDRINNNQ